MLNSIIDYSIRNKFIILIGVLAMIVWGFYSLSKLPIDAVPDITDNQVQIITNSPNLAAQEVEQFITFPLELQLANIPRVEQVRSISRFGLSVITVVFEEKMDIYLARQLIQEQINSVLDDISQYGKPYLGPISTGLGQVYQYILRPAEGFDTVYTTTELRTIQDWIVKRQLAGIPGVIEINSSGGHLKQYEVAVDLDEITALNVTISDVISALENNNENTGGSYIEKEDYTYFIRGEGLLKNFSDIENVIVKQQPNGVPVLIRDVAEIKIGHAPRFGAVTMNGIGEVVSGQVMMLKGSNSNQVTQAIKERIEEIIPTLPEGVILEPYLDRSDLVGRTIRTVQTNLIEGGLIVIFILILLLGNFRAGLIVASVIPLSMLFAISLMQVFEISANLMSLGAIDFGLIVDGAVIIVESVVFRLSFLHGRTLSQVEMDDNVGKATTRILRSAAFGILIILIVYLPIFSLTGIEGKMFKPMASTVSLALLGALLLSMTYVPVIASLTLNKKISSRRTFAEKLIDQLKRLYYPILRLSIKIRYVTITIMLLLFAGSLMLLSRMGGEFIPTLEEGDLALHQMLPPGSSLQNSIKVSGELQDMLTDEFPEVEKVVTKIGTAEIPTDIMPLEAGDIYVIMKPKEEWVSASTREEMFMEMEKVLNRFPGVGYEFTQPIQMLFNELMTGVRQDIAIKIFGEEMGMLNIKARDAERIIKSISGVGDVRVEQVEGLQQISIDYDRESLARYGLSLSEVSELVQTGFAGLITGNIFEGERRFDLVVRLKESARVNIEDLENVLIPLNGGNRIPLKYIATIRSEEGPSQISRDDTKRRITIGVNARQRDVESLVTEIRARLSSELNLPAGYYLRYGGQFENLQKAKERLQIAVPLALAMILILLILAFNSIKQALIIFTAVPMASIGGILSLYLRGMPFSISAGVGFIALFGVAVLNGIVLIAVFNDLKKEGISNIHKRVLTGTMQRLRPVLMTAAVASLGFLPMAISTTAGAEVQRPLATVVIGGLIFSTILTLIVLPNIYALLEHKKVS